MEPLVVVDYGAGNLTSVVNALSFLGLKATASSDPSVIIRADRLVFPGVGAAGTAMQTLNKTGIGKAISDVVKAGRPVLGICIGCQIILDSSEENGNVKTLGLIPGRTVRFRNEPGYKIPHMGWNQVDFKQIHPIFKGIESGRNFYFVHSYHPSDVPFACVFAETTYGLQSFTSALGKDNLIATQFHLEKSGSVGLQVLKNFSEWDGQCLQNG